jgi:hypothetical protein
MISLPEILIKKLPNFTMPEIMTMTVSIPNTFGTFFLFNHLTKGRNKSAMNIERMSGINIKDRIFRT